MSKNLSLLLILTITTCNNLVLASEMNDITDNLENIHKDPKNSSTMLGSLVSNVRGLFGPKKQNSIAQKLFATQELPTKASSDKNGAENKNDAGIGNTVDITEKVTEWCGTRTGQMRDKAKTVFGISFDKQELIYFGASAVVLITIGGIVYVIYKNEYTKKWTLEKVGQDMQKFVGEHKAAVTSAVVAAIVTTIALFCVKKQGMTFERASSWSMSLFTKQSATTKSIETL